MNKKEEILQEISKETINQKEIALKYNVSQAYVSQLVKEIEINKKLKNLEFLKSLFERGAIEIITSKLSNKELERLDII